MTGLAMTVRRTCLVAALALTVIVTTPAAQDVPVNLTGVYLCEGTLPSGKMYRCVLEVAQRGDVVHAKWTFHGEPPAMGLGLLRHGSVSIAYFSPVTAGVAVYRLDNGALTTGEWVGAGSEVVNIERVRPMPADHQAPAPAPPPETKPVGPIREAKTLARRSGADRWERRLPRSARTVAGSRAHAPRPGT